MEPNIARAAAADTRAFIAVLRRIASDRTVEQPPEEHPEEHREPKIEEERIETPDIGKPRRLIEP